MANQEQHYKTIFFDLDGTLLSIDIDWFLTDYFRLLGAFVSQRGYDPKEIIDAVNAGVRSMIEPHQGRNDAVFWQTFEGLSGFSREEFEPLLLEFYSTSFDKMGKDITPDPAALEVVNLLKAKGYQLFLTTMPLFPLVAVEARLRWAGIEDFSLFERITTFDNSHATKPHLAYYQENIDLAAGSAEEILMVGNNTHEDLSCCALGTDAYLVTDWLLNPIDMDYSEMKHGSLSDFLEFAKSLPDCPSEIN